MISSEHKIVRTQKKNQIVSIYRRNAKGGSTDDGQADLEADLREMGAAKRKLLEKSLKSLRF